MRLTITVLTFGILASGLASAKHWHEDEKHRNEHAKHDDEDDRGFDRRNHAASGCYFQPHDAGIITRYYAPRYRELPPGLQKKVSRGGNLPPGWEKRMQPLPVTVEQQLVPLPSGYRRGYLDGYAVVFSAKTQVVIDVVATFGR